MGMSLVQNKKVNMQYEIKESFEAGIELRGYEVKSLSKKQGSLDGARVIIRAGEAYVVGMYIPAYQLANTPESYDPYRVRRLLLKKKEIVELAMALEGTRLTIVPVSLYNKKRIKIEIALATRRKKQDVRQYIQEKDDRRLMRQV
jgi:SsrA-binding protein